VVLTTVRLCRVLVITTCGKVEVVEATAFPLKRVEVGVGFGTVMVSSGALTVDVTWTVVVSAVAVTIVPGVEVDVSGNPAAPLGFAARRSRARS
jgi:hypothetical protein